MGAGKSVVWAAGKSVVQGVDLARLGSMWSTTGSAAGQIQSIGRLDLTRRPYFAHLCSKGTAVPSVC